MISFVKRKVLPLVLLSVLVIATGCQSIGGVDLNKVLVSQVISDSMEGSMNVTLHLVPEQTAGADPATMEMIQAIDGMQVVVESFKQQDWNTMSARGKLVISRGEIPFQISLSRTAMVMQIEGADVPIIIPLDSLSNPLSSLTSMSATNELTTNSLQQKPITESLVSLIVNHLANPQDITVQNVTETVHGESLSLYKVHSDIKGSEIITLLKKSLRNLVMDDQGLKLFIGQLYDVLEANATVEDNNLLGLGLGFGSMGSADRELEIEFIHTSVKQGLLILLMMLEDESMLTELQPIMNDDTYMRSDLYVDSSLHIRKADFELSVSPQLENQADLEGISSVQIEGHGQFWNHNKPVTADTLTYEDSDALHLDLTTPSDDEFISILDHQSVLYKLMKEDLHATRKTAVFYTNTDDMSNELAIFKNGIMTVPARNLADHLGLQLDWNGVTRELTLTSPFDGTIVSFKVDSNKATVNGTDQIMPLATFTDRGQTYIPLRFVTDAIGAKIAWNQETQTAIVTIE